MSSEMTREQEIRGYIVENFLLGEDDGFADSDSLLESGVVDSTGVLELVVFLETNFEIEVQDEDLVPENLDTIRDLASFVERKLNGPAAQAPEAGG